MLPQPDVSFSIHPDHGVVAAVADSRRPFPHKVLQRHPFRHHPSLEPDHYTVPRDAPYNAILRAIAEVTLTLQEAGLSVAADPRIMLPPPVPQPSGTPGLNPVPAQSLTALTAELHGANRPAEAAEILQELLDERFGTLGQLEQLITTAASWCDRLNIDEGREIGSRLRAIADHVTFLGDRIAEVEADLQESTSLIPADAPPLSVAAARPHDGLPPFYEARAKAAMAVSPHRPVHTPASPSPSSPPQPADQPRLGSTRLRPTR